MNYFIKQLATALLFFNVKTDPIPVPLTDAGMDGPCYFCQRDTVNWETLGAITGMLGAFLLAVNAGYQGYGWLAFLVSNVCWISFAILNRFKMLFWQQVAFLASTIIGLYNTFGS